MTRNLPDHVRTAAISNGSLTGKVQEILPYVRAKNSGEYYPGRKLYSPISTAYGWNAKPFDLAYTAVFEPNVLTTTIKGFGADIALYSDPAWTNGTPSTVKFSESYWRRVTGVDFDWDWSCSVLGCSVYPTALSMAGIFSNGFESSNVFTAKNYDYAPGGYFSFFEDVYRPFVEGFNTVPDKIRSQDYVDDESVSGWYDSKGIRFGHATFIPTVSAIDLIPDASVAEDAVQKPEYVYSNLEQTYGAGLSSKTPFDRVYGVSSADLAENDDGLFSGFYHNGMHVYGRSFLNPWRISCEIAISEGSLSAVTNCDDPATFPQWVKDLRTSMIAPYRIDYDQSLLVNSRSVVTENIFGHLKVSHWQGLPPGGWTPVIVRRGTPFPSVGELWVKIPSTYSFAQFDLVLKKTNDGCGWTQLGMKTVPRDGQWHKIQWSLPSGYLDVPSCNNSLASDPSLSVIMNSRAGVNAADEIQIGWDEPAHMTTTGSTVANKALKEGQIIPLYEPWCDLNLGGWGNVARIPDPTGDGDRLQIKFDSPWSGLVLYSKTNKPLDVSAYSYLEISRKVVGGNSKNYVMCFFDDNPDVVKGVTGYRRPSEPVYGGNYNYASTWTKIGATDADGFETLRFPLSRVVRNGVITKLLIQEASFLGESNSTWIIKSLKFAK